MTYLLTFRLNTSCVGDFIIHVNQICPASNGFKNILDEIGLVQSDELPTHNSGNSLHLVIGTQRFEICLVSVSTSDHKWLNFDCLKFRLENCVRNLLSTSEIGKIVNLIDFIEDCFYYLWSVVGSPLIHSFLETLRTISDKNAPEMERGISKHDCFFLR